MSMSRTCSRAFFAILVVACGGEPDARSAMSAESSEGGHNVATSELRDPPTESGPRSPIDARLEVPQGTPDPSGVRLVWIVDRAATVPAPVTVGVALPPGCRLLAGASAEQLGAAAGESRGEMLVACSTLPATDLIVSVDAQSTDFGYHEDLHYGFGRLEPVAPSPTLGAMHVVVGGQDYGRPVMAQPTQAPPTAGTTE